MNGANGMSDIEGKAATATASEAGAERVSTQMLTDPAKDCRHRISPCQSVAQIEQISTFLCLRFTMVKFLGAAVLAVALMASPVSFAGGKACCAKNASNDKAMCLDYASLNVNADQKTKLESWAAECTKAGCTKESRANFLKQAKGILSAEQYAKLKEQCDKGSKHA
jgi:hypothetical protein